MMREGGGGGRDTRVQHKSALEKNERDLRLDSCCQSSTPR